MGSWNLASISLKGYEGEVPKNREISSFGSMSHSNSYTNSLNSGDESACFRCWLKCWHIGHNVNGEELF